MQSIRRNKYADHVRLCENNQPLRIVMPSGELKLKFFTWEKSQKCPFVVYADLEALKVAKNVTKGKSTIIVERQVPASYSAVLVDGRTNSVIAESFYRGEDRINTLMNCFRRWNNWCDSERQKFRNLKDVMSKSHQKAYLASAVDMNCRICNHFVAVFLVIHQCHSTRKVLGIAHSNCNLRAQRKRILPVLFHNLSKYDAHHYLKSLIVRPGEKLLANNRTEEVYISFSLRIKFSEYIWKGGRHMLLYSEVRFLDSFQFMSQSPENLAKLCRRHHSNCFETSFLTWEILISKKFEAKVFPLTIIWTALKIFPKLLLLTGTLGETVCLEKETQVNETMKRQKQFIHWCVANLWRLSRFFWLSMSISNQISLRFSVVFVLKSITWTQFIFLRLQTWVGKECRIPLKLNSVSSVILTCCYFVSEPFGVASMESVPWGISKPTTSTWKTSIDLSHPYLGLSFMSHHSMPERCNSHSHVAFINGETI